MSAAPDHGPGRGRRRRGAIVVPAILMLSLAVSRARAQHPIQDNSFLIEEAYNQEKDVVQHINAFSRASPSGDWVYTFTQEWPLGGQRHQLSYTLPIQDVHSELAASTGIGDLALNYRYQAIGSGASRVAFAPRLSLLLPTGKSRAGLGSGGEGLQLSLPVSWVWSARVVTHWNAGLTHTFSARDEATDKADTNAWSLGQSFVWLLLPRVNLLLETVFVRAQTVTGPGRTETSDAMFVSPGIRWSYNFDNGLQIVPGVAFPIGVGPSRGNHAVFAYLSFEHPFRKAP